MNAESSITQGYRDERAAGGGGWGVITQLREDTEEPSLCCGPQESPPSHTHSHAHHRNTCGEGGDCGGERDALSLSIQQTHGLPSHGAARAVCPLSTAPPGAGGRLAASRPL